jgi:predicted TIM-barrel fold metal-dependent hydrolase
MMALGFRAFDADGHIFENEREIYEFLPSMYHGHEGLLKNGLFPPADSWNRTALAIAGRYKEGSNSELYKRANHQITSKQWLEFLKMGEIDGTVLYPTSGLGFGKVKEAEWAVALAQAYNDWMYENFTKGNPQIHAMALLPIQDPKAAAEELKRCVTKLGAAGGVMIAGHRRRALGDRIYDPVYQAAQDLDKVLAIHAGGPGDRFDIFDRAIQARCLGHPTSLMIEMTSMMFEGVFDRFPRVRFSFMEGGVAWILFLRERMQEAYDQWKVQAPDLKQSPDKHLSSGRIFFHCELDERIIPFAASVLGEDVLLYASDFPHVSPERSLHEKNEFMERKDVPDSAKVKIMRENALRLYGINPAAA